MLVRVVVAVTTALISRKPYAKNGVGMDRKHVRGVPKGSDLAEVGASVSLIGNKGRNDEQHI